MSRLSVQDFQHLLTFANNVHKSYENFEYGILDALAEHLELCFTSYTIHNPVKDETHSVSKNLSRAIEENLLEYYRTEFYKKDIFLNYFNQYRYKAIAQDIFTSNDFPRDTFRNSEYGKFLAKFNIGHQAVIGLKNTTLPPGHTISIYKSSNEEPFTEHELELYSYISKIFDIAVNQYKTHMKQRQTIRVNGAFSDAMGIGYIVLDACGGILYNNDAFLSYGTQLSNKHDLSSLAHELIEKVRVSGKETLGDCRIKSLNIDELTLIVRHKTIPMATGIKKYTLLAIYANKPQVAPGDLRAHFMERYNLTPREAEIMVLMVRGLDNNELSASLFVSMSTIKTHIRNIYSKLEVSSRTELLRKIKQHTSADAN